MGAADAACVCPMDSRQTGDANSALTTGTPVTYAIAPQSDGTILIGGSFLAINKHDGVKWVAFDQIADWYDAKFPFAG